MLKWFAILDISALWLYAEEIAFLINLVVSFSLDDEFHTLGDCSFVGNRSLDLGGGLALVQWAALRREC